MRLLLLHSSVFIYKHLNLFPLSLLQYVPHQQTLYLFFMHVFTRNYSSYYLYIFSSTDVTAEAIMDYPSYITWLATTT